MESVIAISVLLLFIIVGVPIAYSLGAASLVYAMLFPNLPNMIVVQRFVRGPDSFELLAIPMFILAGSILNESGATRRLVKFASALVGHFRGGLAQANIVASMIFAGMSGSANADVAGIGRVLIKAQIDEGYDADFSAAITASSACVGPIIPPSTTMIVYGAAAEVPIATLLIAGAIPGVIMGLLMMIPTYFISKARNYPVHENFCWKRLWDATKESILILFAPVIIIGGTLSGMFTATEAGCVAAFYALIVGAFVYREINLQSVLNILKDMVYTSAMVMFLLACGLAFSWVLSMARVPVLMVNFITSLNLSPTAFLLACCVLFIVLGMFFSVTTNLIMVIPVLYPVVQALGISGVQFGVLAVIGLTIGCVTPPVGAPMYLACNFAGVSIGEFFKANKWYYVTLITSLVLVALFPSLSTWLPSIAGL